MGSILSKRNNSLYSVNVNDLVLAKVSDENPDKKCSTPQYCQLEDIEIEALGKMVAMDEEITTKHNLTTETFNAAYDNFMTNNSEVLRTQEFSTFKEQREKIAETFSGKSFDKKQEAYLEYQDAIERELSKISKRSAKEYTAAQNAEAEAKKNAEAEAAKIAEAEKAAEAQKPPPPPPNPKKK